MKHKTSPPTRTDIHQPFVASPHKRPRPAKSRSLAPASAAATAAIKQRQCSPMSATGALKGLRAGSETSRLREEPANDLL